MPHKSNGHNGVANGNSQKKDKYHLPPMDWSNLDTSKESFEECPLITSCLTFIGFYFLMILGFINQLLFTPKVALEYDREGYPKLYNPFDLFYSWYVYRRIRNCWNRPVCSSPGAEIILKDRITEDHGWSFKYTGKTSKCINLGSYNYMGFAEANGACADACEESIKKYGISLASSRRELGTTQLHLDLEKTVAGYLGTEAAMIVGMGFATNALGLPAILGPGCLAISDEKNHASLILGLRISKSIVAVFRHNDMAHLEQVVRESISNGQDGPGKPWRPWKKIFILVEGVYSMEGTVVHLPQVVAIKNKYKCYLYLDEAHSIGAMGPRGRGITDYYGVDPKEVDILMGTFTKSFGSAGGYLAGSKKLINYIKNNSHAPTYAYSMSPPVAQQIMTSIQIMMGLDGTDIGATKISSLARNTRYFRRRLHQLGVIIYGNEDSPVVPMLVYLFSKIQVVVEDLAKRNVAVIGVGFPATPIYTGRIRFCLSAAHTKEQLDYCLEVIADAVKRFGIDYSRKPRDLTPIEY